MCWWDPKTCILEHPFPVAPSSS